MPNRLAARAQNSLGVSSNFDDAVAISTRLKENMDAEGRCSNECFVEVLAMLGPLQQVCPAALLVLPSRPAAGQQEQSLSLAHPCTPVASLLLSTCDGALSPLRVLGGADTVPEAAGQEASPGLQARMAVESAPFVWDPCALAELLQAQQLRTDSDGLRPGSRSLMEQASQLCVCQVVHLMQMPADPGVGVHIACC